MASLSWDNTSERYFETGFSHGVLFVQNEDGTYQNGVVWNGLIDISEKYSGGDAIHVYSDNVPFMSIYDLEEFGATIKAYTYPDEFQECNGLYTIFPGVTIGMQERKSFALCYRTLIGNDTTGSDYGYKIHILYNCHANPSESDYKTIEDSPGITEFSWDISTQLGDMYGYMPTSIVTIDTRKMDPSKLEKIESILYGKGSMDSTIILPNDFQSLLSTHYLVTENYEPLVFGQNRILV